MDYKTNESYSYNLSKNYVSLDECLNNLFALFHTRSDPKKNTREKLIPYTTATVNTSLGKPRPVNVRVLLDSGGSATIMRKSLAKKLRIKRDKKTTWATLAGSVSTATVAKVQFKLPEFFEDRAVEYNVHLTETLKNYDMIIGRDLLSKLGIDINFSNSTCSWDDSVIPMKPLETQQSTSSYAIEESGILKEATRRLKKILDAKYEPVKIDKVVADSHHLTFQQKHLLDEILRKYEPLFDGSLGHWKAKSVHLELKEGATPYHARPYPIPKSLEIKIKLEIERLIQAGVLKKVNHSTPSGEHQILSYQKKMTLLDSSVISEN